MIQIQEDNRKNRHILLQSEMSNFYSSVFSVFTWTCMYTCDCDSPSSWKTKSCLPVFHPWKPGAKVGVFTEMPVKSHNRFLKFTTTLWTERRVRAAHFLALLRGRLPLTVAVFKDYPRLHTFFCTLFGLEALTMFPFTKLVSTSKDVEVLISFLSTCYLSVLSKLLLSHILPGYSPPCSYFQWFITWEINCLWLMWKSWYTKSDDWLKLLLWD